MLVVPESAREFFTDYLPKRFDALRDSFAGRSSQGSLVFEVPGEGSWSFRLKDGALEVGEGVAEDVIVRVSVKAEDFGPVFVQAAQQLGDSIRPEAQAMAFKALSIDAERVKLVRNVPGTLAFVVQEGEKKYQVFVTPGTGTPKLEAPDCRLEVGIGDFLELQIGKVNPMQLVMGGKMKIVGNAQLPMALSSVFT